MGPKFAGSGTAVGVAPTSRFGPKKPSPELGEEKLGSTIPSCPLRWRFSRNVMPGKVGAVIASSMMGCESAGIRAPIT